MKKYRIEVTELLGRVVEIVADSNKEAIQTVKAMYNNSTIVLDASDYVITEFSVKGE